MDTSLLQGLPILLCCFRVLSGSFLSRDQSSASTDFRLLHESNLREAIQCRMCHLQFPGENCTKARGICTATMNEACSTGTIFKKDGTLWLTFMGCLKNCANVNNMKWSIYLVNFRCCRSSHFCNDYI
ncbi:prostate and testis expressed protein 1 [Saccopteryx leptura]|uniref:prostate and testis expressed protein 1 n=1 Tax=Saccopteryx leptura TaxID=249018 RepID=UPI00339C0D72